MNKITNRIFKLGGNNVNFGESNWPSEDYNNSNEALIAYTSEIEVQTIICAINFEKSTASGSFTYTPFINFVFDFFTDGTKVGGSSTGVRDTNDDYYAVVTSYDENDNSSIAAAKWSVANASTVDGSSSVSEGTEGIVASGNGGLSGGNGGTASGEFETKDTFKDFDNNKDYQIRWQGDVVITEVGSGTSTVTLSMGGVTIKQWVSDPGYDSNTVFDLYIDESGDTATLYVDGVEEVSAVNISGATDYMIKWEFTCNEPSGGANEASASVTVSRLRYAEASTTPQFVSSIDTASITIEKFCIYHILNSTDATLQVSMSANNGSNFDNYNNKEFDRITNTGTQSATKIVNTIPATITSGDNHHQQITEYGYMYHE